VSYGIIDTVSFFDVDRLEGPGAVALADQYQRAEPFPHIVLEDFVVARPDEVLGQFPDPDWKDWTDVSNEFQPGKSSCDELGSLPPVFREMIHELSEPRFLKALSELIGIPQMLPDPFLQGGGLHLSGPGGKLTPHTDFHFHRNLQLFRRANILIYLNPSWKPGDGGELGLFKLGVDEPEILVAPRYGTCVIFTTDHLSVHGVTPISDTSPPRRSIALYYYTIEETDLFSGDRKTYWYEPTAAVRRTTTGKVRALTMRTALRGSKVLTRVAYRVDPQHPIGLRRS
jgi:hypothetical protein